jgi:hypothetical protein
MRKDSETTISPIVVGNTHFNPGCSSEIINLAITRHILAAEARGRAAGDERIKYLEATLRAIQPSLPVLRAMLLSADLHIGVETADAMRQWVAEALAEKFPT